LQSPASCPVPPVLQIFPWRHPSSIYPCLVPTQRTQLQPPPSSLTPICGSASDPWIESHMGEGSQGGKQQLGPTQRAQASPSALLPCTCRVWCKLRVKRGLREPTASRDLSAKRRGRPHVNPGSECLPRGGAAQARLGSSPMPSLPRLRHPCHVTCSSLAQACCLPHQ
uniref:Uncharacterized protein n=1 Tax=Marmota marmota marmota TaxID=9994 RepID=A0A8C6ETS6_MARMA